MPRFNNGTPGRNGIGFGMGGMGAGLGRGAGGGRGRGANCRGNGPGFGFGTGNNPGIGQAQVAQRNPGFFRRFCLGLTEQPGSATNTRLGGIQSVIDDLQRQINALKNSTDK